MENREPSPTYVAVDLETTGLDSDRDTIIEVGAVRFRGHDVLGTFETLVNPYRDLPPFIQRLTGISQSSVDQAPPFGAVAGELRDFVGSLPVVGHNISFDLKFLSKHGVQLINPAYDTWDLASILLPYFTSYSLAHLASEMGAGQGRPHRALTDARTTHLVFVNLLERASSLDPATLAYIQHLAARAQWPLGRLLATLPPVANSRVAVPGVAGLDTDALAQRLDRVEHTSRPTAATERVDPTEPAAHLSAGGLLSREFPGFEYRPQQVEMTRAVAEAMSAGEHLIVEAGTGVGKSLAYLLPAVLYSLKTGSRVVVSTNTINLQEQLLGKDIPALVGVLERAGIIPPGELKAVGLKGRANYVCLRRWNQLARGESLSGDDARLLGKTLVWFRDTSTGDRAEINLSGRDATTWQRVSAGEKGHCPGIRGEGPCFLRAARDSAQGAHIVVVTHALLLSDLAMGGGVLPEYQHLIVDEAQHLEEEATRQLGFQLPQETLHEEFDALLRLLVDVRVFLRGCAASGIRVEQGEELVAELESRSLVRIRELWNRLWALVEEFQGRQMAGTGDQLQLRITRSVRAQPGWSHLEIGWENVEAGLTDGIRQVERLLRFLEPLSSAGPVDLENVVPELSAWLEGLGELRERLRDLLAGPSEDRRIDWMARASQARGEPAGRSQMVLHSAPLNVGPELDARLYARKSSVILTSATLSSQGSFDYIRDRLGLPESRELLVGSPFDYRRAALILIPEDMPWPDSWGYQDAMEKVLVSLGQTLGGRTLALFTSHAALRIAARALRGLLEPEGVRVLAQGVDGSPRQIVRTFGENPRAVVLGTSSFWEGVDLSGGILKALVVARLPFNVPSEPVFAARSSEYEDPFTQYAVPQAILRFRQGMGRLIRSAQDRGAIVVLDKRIAARPYGKAFLESLPPCTRRTVLLSAISDQAAAWVKEGR